MLYMSTSIGVQLMPNCGQNMPFYIFCMKNEQKGRKIKKSLGFWACIQTLVNSFITLKTCFNWLQRSYNIAVAVAVAIT